jgi:hypothetical protein
VVSSFTTKWLHSSAKLNYIQAVRMHTLKSSESNIWGVFIIHRSENYFLHTSISSDYNIKLKHFLSMNLMHLVARPHFKQCGKHTEPASTIYGNYGYNSVDLTNHSGTCIICREFSEEQSLLLTYRILTTKSVPHFWRESEKHDATSNQWCHHEPTIQAKKQKKKHRNRVRERFVH